MFHVNFKRMCILILVKLFFVYLLIPSDLMCHLRSVFPYFLSNYLSTDVNGLLKFPYYCYCPILLCISVGTCVTYLGVLMLGVYTFTIAMSSD